MTAKVTCPACSRENAVNAFRRSVVPGQLCSHCKAPLDAAKVPSPPPSKPSRTIRQCAACGEELFVPGAEVEAFEARGMRCRACAAVAVEAAPVSDDRRVLGDLLDDALAKTNWADVPLSKKAAILAEVLK